MNTDNQHILVDTQIQQLETNLFQTKLQLKMMEANLEVLKSEKNSLDPPSPEYKPPVVGVSKRQPEQRLQR